MKATLKDSVRELRKKAVIAAFYDTMKKVSSANPFFTIDEVVRKARLTPAPRFFVTYENARRFVSLLVRKGEMPLLNENKLQMYKELYRRYMQRIQYGRNRFRILESIIEEPAPSFYLDVESFRGIIYKTLRRR